MERNGPWVSEVVYTKLGSWGKRTLRALIGTSSHCIAESRCSRAWGGQTDIRMTLLKNECPRTVFRIVTLQWPFARHSDGPADFILLGAFHHSARCTVPSNAKSREGRENRANQAKRQRYTRFLGLHHPPVSALYIRAKTLSNSQIFSPSNKY